MGRRRTPAVGLLLYSAPNRPPTSNRVRNHPAGRHPPPPASTESGLVARVYPAEELVDQAVAMAAKIGSMSLPVALLAKEATNAAFEGTLAEGSRLERRMFHSCFALVSARQQGEGMTAYNSIDDQWFPRGGSPRQNESWQR